MATDAPRHVGAASAADVTPAAGGAALRVDSRTVFAIALPMTLAYLSTPLMGLVNTAVVGRLGHPVLLGGMAVGAVAFDTVFSLFGFLRAGTTGLTAQAIGAGDATRSLAVCGRALLLSAGLGLALLAVQGPVLALLLAFIGADGQVSAVAADYYRIRILSAPLALANYALLGWILGEGRSGVALALQSVLNVVNAGVGAVLVLALGYGVAGAALGAVAGEAAACLLGLLVAARAALRTRRPSARALLDRAETFRMFALNRDILIRTLCLLFAFVWFTRQGAALGATVLASNALLLNLFFTGSYVLDGLAAAAEQIVGRALGAGARHAFKSAVRLCVAWGFAFAAVVSGLFLVFGASLVDWMTTVPEVRRQASHDLVFAAATPLCTVLAFVLDGVFIGAAWSADMRNMMLLSLGLFLGFAAVAVPAWGNEGLWLAFLAFLALRGLTLALRLRRRAV